MCLRKIIVGLGNPGRRYQRTPHNLGFEVVEALVAEAGIAGEFEECQALTQRAKISELEVLLARPQTYMNLSGEAVCGLLARNGLAPADLIVVADDLALPFGKIRIRARGSAGGHKGLKSIIDCLGTREFVRVRLGIGLESNPLDAEDYVLTPIAKDLRAIAAEMVEKGKEAVQGICVAGLETAMNRFN